MSSATQAKKPAARVDPRMLRIYGNRLASAEAIDEVDGTGTHMRLMTTPRSQHQAAFSGSGSGAVSFRGVVIGGVSTRSYATHNNGTFINYNMTVVVVSDAPQPEEVYDLDKKKVPLPSSLVFNEQQLRIAASDAVIRDLEDPHALRVKGVGVAPKADADGKDSRSRSKEFYLRNTGRACLGAVINLSVNATKAEPPREPRQGDLYEFAGVIYKVDRGTDKSMQGGNNNSGMFYESWAAGSAKLLSNWWDESCWASHNELSAILFAFAPMRSAPLPVPIIEPGFSVKKEIALLQKRKKAEMVSEHNDESLKLLYYDGNGAAGGEADGNNNSADARSAEALDAVDSVIALTDKEKSKLAREALTLQSRREFNNAVWITPVTGTISPAVADYMAEHGIPYKEWYFVGFNEKREACLVPSPDPSVRANFVMQASREEQMLDKDRKPDIVFADPRPGMLTPEGKPLRYCPVFNITLQCSQPLPSHALQGEPVDPATGRPLRSHDRQAIDVHTRIGSHSLNVYGIQDPLTMGLIVPQLASVTPGLAMCYHTNALEVLENMPANPADPILPMYRLSGCVSCTDRARDRSTPKRDTPALFLDPVIGIINAGVPITHEAAMRLYKWANKAFEKNPYAKVSADGNMSHTAYAKKEYYANTTHLAGLPYINCWETRANFADEGAKGEWIAFAVSTYIQKPSRYFEEMNALYQALRDTPNPMEAARRFWGKLIVDIAEKKARLGQPQSVLDASSADEVIANLEAVKAYAAELAKEAGLSEFPFDPLRMAYVFGPIHPAGTEPDFSSDKALPFHCSMFAVATHYLERRGLIDYVGDDAFQEVVIAKQHAAYADAARSVHDGKAESYKTYRAKVEEIRAKTEERSRTLKAREHPAAAADEGAAPAKAQGTEGPAGATEPKAAKPVAKPAPAGASKPPAVTASSVSALVKPGAKAAAAAAAAAKPGAAKPAAAKAPAAKPAAAAATHGDAEMTDAPAPRKIELELEEENPFAF